MSSAAGLPADIGKGAAGPPLDHRRGCMSEKRGVGDVRAVFPEIDRYHFVNQKLVEPANAGGRPIL